MLGRQCWWLPAQIIAANTATVRTITATTRRFGRSITRPWFRAIRCAALASVKPALKSVASYRIAAASSGTSRSAAYGTLSTDGNAIAVAGPMSRPT
jgi:hypothetical protein